MQLYPLLCINRVAAGVISPYRIVDGTNLFFIANIQMQVTGVIHTSPDVMHTDVERLTQREIFSLVRRAGRGVRRVPGGGPRDRRHRRDHRRRRVNDRRRRRGAGRGIGRVIFRFCRRWCGPIRFGIFSRSRNMPGRRARGKAGVCRRSGMKRRCFIFRTTMR